MFPNPTINIFGEVLFDHFPDGSRVLGGAPFNVAWHLQAFGLSPHFISRVGNDTDGQEIRRLMAVWGMDCSGLQLDDNHMTGSVQVQLVEGEPHYDIVADSAYDFIAAESLADQAGDILYHGSLALRNPVSRAALAQLKTGHPGKIFVDVNLRPPWWEQGLLGALLQDADWVKLNQDELAQLHPGQGDMEATMRSFVDTFALETLVVTCGAEGAVAMGKDWQPVKVKPEANLKVVDTVGAGDAFASVLLLGVSKSWPLALTLERAQGFAGAVVGQRGATADDASFYAPFIRQWF